MKHPYLHLPKSLFLILYIGAVLCPTAAAQTPPALRGTVTDLADGLPLMGVRVSLPALRRTAVSDAEGRYRFDRLPAGKTHIEVSYPGHRPLSAEVSLPADSVLHFRLEETSAQLGEALVTGVTGQTLRRLSSAPVSVLSGEQLKAMPSASVADVLSHEAGVEKLSSGSGIAKPVVRGLGHTRLVVMDDGVRQEGQQWGDEHGIEIDAQGVSSAEVIKGPASLLYGSDALAGVVLLKGAPAVAEGELQGSVSADFQSNAGLFGSSAFVAGTSRGGLSWSGRVSGRQAHAYKSPRDGYVAGSAFQERAAQGLIGLSRRWGHSHLQLKYHSLTPSLIEGERNANGRFVLERLAADGQAEEREARRADLMSYGHGFPYQRVTHTKLTSDNLLLMPHGRLTLTVALQQNRRREYEEVEHASEAGLHMLLQTLTYDLRYTLADLGGWRLAAAAGGMVQRSQNKGDEYLIPDYHLADFGSAVTASRTFGTLAVNGGVRYDVRRLHALALTDEDGSRFSDFRRRFASTSGSAGLTWNAARGLTLRLNAARGFRAPNIAELGSNGVHEGTFRHETGNAALRPEKSWQFDLGADYSSAVVSAQVALFANFISHYIYLERYAAPAGSLAPLPYRYASGRARLWGGELSLDIHPVERLHVESSLAFVKARQARPRLSPYLPFVPPAHLKNEVRYAIVRDGRTLTDTYLSLTADVHFRQRECHLAGNTERPAPSYTLLGVAAGTDVRLWGRRLTFCLTVDNLLNRAYQDHLSRLKYAPVNPLTGEQGICNPGRSVNLRAVIPLFGK